MDRPHCTPPPQAVYPLTPPPTGHRHEKSKSKVSQVIPPNSPTIPKHEPTTPEWPDSDIVVVDGIELPAIIRNAKQPSGSPGPTTWRFVDLGPPTTEAHTHPDPEKNNDCASHNEVNDADDDHDALLDVLHRATARGTPCPPFGGIAIRPYSGAGGVWWCPSAMSGRDAADILASASSSGTSNPDTPVKADEIRETLACEKRGNGRNVSLLPLTIVDDESDEELLRESKHEPMDVDPDIDMGDMLYVRTERSQAIVRREPATGMVIARNGNNGVVHFGSSSKALSKRARPVLGTGYDSSDDEDIEYTGSLHPLHKRPRGEEAESREMTPLQEVIKCPTCNCSCGGQPRDGREHSADSESGHHGADRGDSAAPAGRIAWSKSLSRKVLGNILHALLNEGGSLRTKWGNKAGHWAELAVAMGAEGGDHDRVRNVARRMQEYLPEMMRRGQI